MVNTENFIARLENLMEFYQLSPSLFADKIGVQRSGISHLLSGRNKPSLDFVLKICEEFPEVNLYWLLNGSENMLRNEAAPNPLARPEIEIPERQNIPVRPEETVKKPLAVSQPPIYKIVIFYQDGSFRDFYQGS